MQSTMYFQFLYSYHLTATSCLLVLVALSVIWRFSKVPSNPFFQFSFYFLGSQLLPRLSKKESTRGDSSSLDLRPSKKHISRYCEVINLYGLVLYWYTRRPRDSHSVYPVQMLNSSSSRRQRTWRKSTEPMMMNFHSMRLQNRFNLNLTLFCFLITYPISRCSCLPTPCMVSTGMMKGAARELALCEHSAMSRQCIFHPWFRIWWR